MAADEGEVPIGAVVVYDGQVIARAHNRREQDKDPALMPNTVRWLWHLAF